MLKFRMRIKRLQEKQKNEKKNTSDLSSIGAGKVLHFQANEDVEGNTELIDWIQNHPFLKNQFNLPVSSDLQHLIDFHWPFASTVYNALPVLFLMQVLDLSLLKKSSNWFVRDGFFGVLWFFKRFPKPGALSSTLFIDARWKGVVPKAWYSKVNYWEIVRLETSAEIKKVIFCGLAVPTTVVKEEFESDLDAASKYLKGLDPSVQKLAFLPARFKATAQDASAFHMEFYFEIARRFGTDFKVIGFSEIQSSYQMSEIHLVNLFSKVLLSDDYLTSLFLSRGGTVTGVREVKEEKEITWRASAYHGYVFSSEAPTEQDVLKTKNTLAVLLNSSCFLDQPWPAWFSGWSTPR